MIGGFVGTNDEALAERLRFLQKSLGAVPGPVRRLARAARDQDARACGCASTARTRARSPPSSRSTRRSSASSTPACRAIPATRSRGAQMRDFGGMVSFLVESEEEAVALAARTKLFQLAESLGGVESLIEHPARMTHASTADAPFAAPRNLIRLSVGIEAVDDLIADLEAALVGARCARPRLRAAMLEPIDLDFLGFARAIGVYLVETPRRPRALRLRARRRRCRGSARAARARARAHRHPAPAPLAHPPRPRRRRRADRARAPGPHRLGVRDRRAAPRRPLAARGLGTAALRRPVRHALGRARARSGGERRGSRTATSSAGRRSRRRATPRTTSATSATGRSSPAMPAASALQPSEYVLPVAPPPDIDVEAWHADDRRDRSAASPSGSR